MIAKKFEDLIFWQKARELAKMIYTLTKNNPFSQDFGLRGQIQRSSVSVMSNIAEGFGRGSNVEFLQFLFIAKGSVSEVQSQLYVALDSGYITENEFRKAYNLCDEIIKIMTRFIMKIKESGKVGIKFKKEYKTFRDDFQEFYEDWQKNYKPSHSEL